MNWTPGLILRIKNYKFEDDGSSKDKYAIVLYTNEHEAFLIHSLTTSQNNLSVPATAFGCSVYNNIPYYFIPKNQVIGNQNFSFEKDTYIFFMNNIRKETFVKFDKAAAASLFGITPLGTLSDEELKRLLKCALKSKYITLHIQQELQQFKELL